MRTIWKGILSFGLVSIPINLYSAVSPKIVKFRLLHKKDNSQIKYKKFCEKENKEISWDDVVKGFEISKKNYFIFSKEDFEKLKPEKSDYIKIIEFVDKEQLDPIYFNSHYYLAPQTKKDKAFFLFKTVMQSTNKIAVGQFVFHDKENICVLSPYKSGILLTTLNYNYEIRDITQIEELSQPVKFSEQELKLARTLIEQMYTDEFQITKFKDSFKEQLLELVDKKEKGELPKTKRKIKSEPNLMKSLRASLK